MANLHILIWIC